MMKVDKLKYDEKNKYNDAKSAIIRHFKIFLKPGKNLLKIYLKIIMRYLSLSCHFTSNFHQARASYFGPGYLLRG